MSSTVQTIEDYLLYLEEKGFHLREDARGFISFGKHYTGASDEIVNCAIEWTLKVQKEFDGSFFMSLLENLTTQNITSRKRAYLFLKQRGMIQ
ncbi:DUF6123 family protein [Bacillus songklensis]|uniref:DUF6123 family protein n=1 Tax=Bacillus songklensis TaxID=1069116 RepID=A0ABV8B1I5_9BACI